ncbi:MAG: Sua5/YciO/YrdC/YwlC family protein, partial [Chloroflexi bacterium]|nr:Sua5/YciO/YrdC/YwlC family protein [Chloroflexota bacterium]
MALPAQHEVLQGQIETAVVALRKGGVVAVPTDTLYGLAASVLDETAVRRVFRLKGRPEGGAMPILLDDLDRVAMCADEIPDVAWVLMERFWPGALTLVLHRSQGIPSTVSGGMDTVALRVPD